MAKEIPNQTSDLDKLRILKGLRNGQHSYIYSNQGRYQTRGQFNSGIGIDYFKTNGIEKLLIGIEFFLIGIGIEVSYQKLNPQINLPFLQR